MRSMQRTWRGAFGNLLSKGKRSMYSSQKAEVSGVAYQKQPGISTFYHYFECHSESLAVKYESRG